MKSKKPTTVAELSPAWQELVAAALDARRHVHAPYSHYPVGAALRTGAGRIYAGCNIENASYGLTVCAERVAIWKAVSEGEKDFNALVVVTENGGMPCGACRQVLSEFAVDLPIAIADTAGHVTLTSLEALLPDPFPRVEAQDLARR